MEDEKIVSKLNFIKKECEEELDYIKDIPVYSDLISMLKKVVKNCEVSEKLIKEYIETKYSREVLS